MRLFRVPTCIFLLSLSFPVFADAQPQPGDIGLFADMEGTQTTLEVTPDEQQSIFLVAFDVPHGIERINLSIDGLEPSAGIAQYEISWLPAGAFWINICCPVSWIVIQSDCEHTTGARVLARIDFTTTDDIPADHAIRVAGSVVSTFNPAAPQYNDCNETPHRFGIAANGDGRYPDGALILNPTMEGPVSEEVASWSAVKSLFE